MFATLAAAEILTSDCPDGMTELREYLVAMRADGGAAIEAADRVPNEGRAIWSGGGRG